MRSQDACVNLSSQYSNSAKPWFRFKLNRKMSSAAGSNALMALKSKMQTLRDELDKANDQLEAKDREFEKERESRIQVD